MSNIHDPSGIDCTFDHCLDNVWERLEVVLVLTGLQDFLGERLSLVHFPLDASMVKYALESGYLFTTLYSPHSHLQNSKTLDDAGFSESRHWVFNLWFRNHCCCLYVQHSLYFVVYVCKGVDNRWLIPFDSVLTGERMKTFPFVEVGEPSLII